MNIFTKPQGTIVKARTDLHGLALAATLILCSVSPQAAADTIRVNSAVTVSGDGSSWGNAVKFLSSALSSAQPGDEIWVASANGVPYRPDQSALHPSGSGDRNASFVIKATVKVYGGFIGTESSLGQRSPTLNPTILSGDLLQNDVDADLQNFGANSTFAENSYHVVTATSQIGLPVLDSTILDGFVIERGSADFPTGSDHRRYGGGIFLGLSGTSDLPSSPSVRNCVLRLNRASIGGGAIVSGKGSITLRNCRFESNYAHDNFGLTLSGGGGIRKAGSGSDILKLLSCTFSGNETWEHGGAVRTSSVSLRVWNCDFRLNNGLSLGNSNGGAIYVGGGSGHQFVNSAFWNNEGFKGGGLRTDNATFVMTNCTFGKNHARGAYGGGISMANFSSQLAPPELRNCVLYGNTSLNTNPTHQQIDDEASSGMCDYLADNSCVDGITLASGCPGVGSNNISSDPEFADMSAGNLRLLGSSPCVDTGEVTYVASDTEDVDSDSDVLEAAPELDLNDRICVIVDMGAYETRCPGDLNCDFAVDAADLGLLLGNWGGRGIGDLNHDGIVDAADLSILLGAWGTCAGDAPFSGEQSAMYPPTEGAGLDPITVASMFGFLTVDEFLAYVSSLDEESMIALLKTLFGS
jgi:hypothetical protein